MQNVKVYEVLARMGYAARGVIYLTIGALASLSVLGSDQEKPNSREAIISLNTQPYGEGLLIALVIGLVGYVVWRLIQALNDADNHGTSIKGLAIRAGLLISALSHSVLCYWVVKLLMYEDQSSGGSSSSVTHFLSDETQAFIFAGVGIAMIGVGFAHLFKGAKSGFQKYVEFPSLVRFILKPICQFGLAARGIVWLIVGWIVTRSAIQAGSSDQKGMKEAFEWLSDSPYGGWLVIITAVGLFAFGLYSCLEALYRRIEK